jgi:hypothetical protein
MVDQTLAKVNTFSLPDTKITTIRFSEISLAVNISNENTEIRLLDNGDISIQVKKDLP